MAAIELHGLTKRFGAVTAVDDLTLELEAGTVTGFLGPNGAGKTTTLRMLLGLVTPTAGTRHVRRPPLRRPRRTRPPGRCRAGGRRASIPGRRAVDHLRILASAAGLPAQRVDEALDTGRHGRARAAAASAGSRSACANVSASPPPCSVSPPCSSSTSPPTASIPRACTGCGPSCAARPTPAAPSSCPATCSPRSPRPSTTS